MSVLGLPTLSMAQTGLTAEGAPAEPEVPLPEPGEARGSTTQGESSEAATRAAVLPLVVKGDPLPEADREQLIGRLVEGLGRGNIEVVAPADVLASSPSAASCTAAGCYASIAAASGSTHVVQATIMSADRDFEVRVVLFDGEGGAEAAASNDSCQICGVAEVGDLIDAAASTLRNKLDALAQGPATLAVSSVPEGAQVSIDGELKGTTPFNAPVLPGKHVLRISKAGFITVERETTFVEGIEENQSFELEKVPSRLPARPWGWVSLGVGAAGLGAAAAFAVLGQTEVGYTLSGSCDVPDEQGDCPRVWNTEGIVLGTAIAGAALTTLGVAILLNSTRRDAPIDRGKETARRSRRPRVGVGLGSVSVRGRF